MACFRVNGLHFGVLEISIVFLEVLKKWSTFSLLYAAFLQSLFASWSVYVLCKFREPYNTCFNERLHMNFVDFLKGLVPKNARLGCGQALSQRSVVLEIFHEIGPF